MCFPDDAMHTDIVKLKTQILTELNYACNIQHHPVSLILETVTASNFLLYIIMKYYFLKRTASLIQIKFRTNSVGILTIFRRFMVFFVFHHDEIETEQIDGDRVSTGKVLLYARQESLSEEKSRNPELRRRSQVVPILKELQAVQEIVDVGAERLQGRIRLFHPHCRDLWLQNAGRHFFQLRRHDHKTFNGLPDVDQAAANDTRECVETDHFLDEDSVHTLLVASRISP